MVCKIFFCSKFPDIPEKSRRVNKTNSKAIAKRSALQANAESYCCNFPLVKVAYLSD